MRFLPDSVLLLSTDMDVGRLFIIEQRRPSMEIDVRASLHVYILYVLYNILYVQYTLSVRPFK